MTDAQELQDVISKIAALAASVNGSGAGHDHAAQVGCSIKFLPPRLLEKGAAYARKVNPLNGPVMGQVAALAQPGSVTKAMISVLTSKYWGPSARTLTVSFMQPTAPDLRARILQHMNAWSATAGIQFQDLGGGVGDVRISFGPGGYWSYLGTDIKLIPTDQPTMNLEGFSMATPESEYLRVVRHETGHTMGFPHEHMRRDLVSRIDPAKAYPYFLATQGWTKDVVDQQVLTPLDEASLYGTPADQTSIMCYQLPGSITFDGQPIMGGVDINLTDYAFAALIYPKISFQPSTVATAAPAKAANTGMYWSHVEFVPDWGAAKDPAVTI